MQVKYSDDQARDERGRFEDQGPSPLDYTPSSYLHPDRLAIVDDTAGEHPKGDGYFAEQTRTTRVGAGGRMLKNPRTIVTPGAKPGTVAFVDYTKPNPTTLHINYMKVRSDQSGQGHGLRLVTELVNRHRDARVVDFGKIMHPAAGRIRQQIADRFPDRTVTGRRDY